MKKRVVVYRALPPDVLGLLQAQCDVIVADADTDRAAFLEALKHAHGMIGNKLKVGAALLEGAPELEAASTISAGYDDFEVPALTQRGVLLCNTPDEVTETTADLTFTLVLATARRIAELDAWTRRGEWKQSAGAAQFGVDVHHKTLGIVGLGRIGGAVAKRAAHGFGMQVLYSNRSRNAEAERAYGAQWKPLDELLAQSDFVVVLVPLSPATTQLIGARELQLMKPSAVLVNCARGQVVDEAALIEALREKRIRGAGLDVFEREPLPESPLYALENTVLVPHIGSATRETREAMARRAALNLLEALSGRLPVASVNPQAREADPKTTSRAE
ncbi:bifunctional glyoxylate/hydroxypyruvate reductase B [Burkholderia sp. WAC0059]|uniref:2-hydroxyacid dehydrogenase n=1 Tax=Burkholderia sp. WAC0059 TaxID=2066022 RepID=UPI000C7EFEDE|nr:D-glycerate dehydrogenase [Burkholderia sp. WAC0059]PLZ03885.1 bifunctional glyoxylate/hydroxypyruvate reductase B [Burkholderia sp. WAC0059]